jgi:formiminotetrahydrofolate cyclodeaminase
LALRQAGRQLTEAIDRDAESYDAVLAALKLPKETAEERARREVEIDRATRHATQVPMETAIAAVEVFEKLVQLEALAAPSMLSDLHVGHLLAVAAARGALENVAINIASIGDSAYVSEMKSRAAAIEARLTAGPVTAGD